MCSSLYFFFFFISAKVMFSMFLEPSDQENIALMFDKTDHIRSTRKGALLQVSQNRRGRGKQYEIYFFSKVRVRDLNREEIIF